MPQEPSPAATCLAGTAKGIITPPTGASLAGYFQDRKSDSIRDDLFARAAYFEKEGERLAIVSCDLITPADDFVTPAKQLIEKECDIPVSHILIGATHTHTGPEVRPNSVVPRCDEIVEKLPRLVADAVLRAAEAAVLCTLRAGAASAEGYSFNRLFRQKDGSEVFGRRGPESELGPAGPVDPEMVTLSAVDENDQLIALLVNFALHVDVIGGRGANFISADWPGEMANCVAAIYGDQANALLLQGTSGDINHNPHAPTSLPTRGPAKAIQLGRALAGAAMVATERAEPMKEIALDSRCEIIRIPYYSRDTRLKGEVEALRNKQKRTEMEDYIIQRFDSWPFDGKMAEAPIQAMRIGELAIGGFPSELFVKLGLELKQWSPARWTMAAELCNTRVSTYVATTDQAERGAYGAKPILSRWLCADGGRRMIDKCQTMLHEIWNSS